MSHKELTIKSEPIDCYNLLITIDKTNRILINLLNNLIIWIEEIYLEVNNLTISEINSLIIFK